MLGIRDTHQGKVMKVLMAAVAVLVGGCADAEPDLAEERAYNALRERLDLPGLEAWIEAPCEESGIESLYVDSQGRLTPFGDEVDETCYSVESEEVD